MTLWFTFFSRFSPSPFSLSSTRVGSDKNRQTHNHFFFSFFSSRPFFFLFPPSHGGMTSPAILNKTMSPLLPSFLPSSSHRETFSSSFPFSPCFGSTEGDGRGRLAVNPARSLFSPPLFFPIVIFSFSPFPPLLFFIQNFFSSGKIELLLTGSPPPLLSPLSPLYTFFLFFCEKPADLVPRALFFPFPLFRRVFFFIPPHPLFGNVIATDSITEGAA